MKLESNRLLNLHKRLFKFLSQLFFSQFRQISKMFEILVTITTPTVNIIFKTISDFDSSCKYTYGS